VRDKTTKPCFKFANLYNSFIRLLRIQLKESIHLGYILKCAHFHMLSEREEEEDFHMF